jgi:C1A family cysteine protease
MNTKLLTLIGVFALLAIGFHHMKGEDRIVNPDVTEEKALWESWKAKHNKEYTSEEEVYRFSVFKANLIKIREHNASGSSYSLGLTNFADLLQDEFVALYIGPKWDMSKIPNRPATISELSAGLTQSVPSINWTTQGVVGPVNNQGQCGSCWSFSAAESIQSAWAVAGKGLPQLSEEQLVQCSGAYGNEGCNGGWPYQAYNYVE